MRTLLLFVLLAAVPCLVLSQQPTAPPDEAKQLYDRAVVLIRSGAPADAIPLLLQAETLEPKRVAIKSALGAAYFNAKRYRDAVAVLHTAIALAPQNAQLHESLCGALIELGQGTDAVNECREAVRLEPRPSSQSRLARALSITNRRSEAILLLESASRQFGNDVELIATLGDLYIAEAEFQKALIQYERVRQLKPDIGYTYLALSEIYAKLDRQNDSIGAARKYVDINPQLRASHFNLGVRLHEAGFYVEAIAAFSKAVEIDTSYGEGYRALSYSYEAVGDKENTLGSLEHAYKYLKPDFDTSFRLGEMREHYGKMDAAVAPLEQANALQPDNPAVLRRLGLAYFESNKFDKALTVLTRSDELRPNNDTTIMYLRVARARKKMAEGFETYLDAVSKNPTDFDALSSLADVYRYKGMLKEAEATYLGAIATAPKDYRGYNRLGIFFADTGNLENALEYYRKAAEITNHHVAFFAVARTLRRLGRLDEAIAALRKAVEIKPAFADGFIELGDLQMRKGDREAARLSYLRAFDSASGKPEPNFALAWFYIRVGDKAGAIRHYQILKGLIDASTLRYLTRSIRANYGPDAI